MSVEAAQLGSPEPLARRRHAPTWGRWGLRATAISYLGLMIVLPLSAILTSGLSGGLQAFWREITNPLAFGALRLTLLTAVLTTLINLFMGTLTAYVLVRYEFRGRGLLNAVVDLPFAIPTLVTGVMLVVLYGPQRTLGAWLEAHGFQVIFATPGIIMALLLVSYPFVIRTVQPVLMELDRAQEQAAYTMGATPWQAFRHITLPAIRWGLLYGVSLTFARALGEFGAVLVVSGGVSGRTETSTLYIFRSLDDRNYVGAYAAAAELAAITFVILIVMEFFRKRSTTHEP
jgi:sulfate transport system permease protein